MPKYRKVFTRFWGDEKVKPLPIAEKTVALYLFTSDQTNRIGLYRFSIAKACDDLNLNPRAFKQLFDTVCHTLSIRYDVRSSVLFIPTWWKYNCPDNGKALKGYLTDLGDLPDTALLPVFTANLRYLPEQFHQPFKDRMAYGMAYGTRYGMPYKDQEQEQDQEQEKETPLTPQGAPTLPLELPPGKGKPEMTVRELVESWNDICASEGLPRVDPEEVRAGDPRYRKAQLRLRRYPTLAFWEAVLNSVIVSPFLRGDNGGWRCTLDFLLANDTNPLKVKEGAYAPGAKEGGS